MDHLKIALLQIAPGGTQEANLQKGLDACRKAREKGADIALFFDIACLLLSKISLRSRALGSASN